MAVNKVTITRDEFEAIQAKIKALEEQSIMRFLKNTYKDNIVFNGIEGKSLDLDGILTYLEAVLDDDLSIYVQVEDENMVLTDRVANLDDTLDAGSFNEENDEHIDGGTF